MATVLKTALTRMVEHNGEWYRIVLSESGLRCSVKGRQRSWQFTWSELLEDRDAERTRATATRATPAPPALGMPPIVAADVLVLMRRAGESLTEASLLITNASDLPATLAAHREPPERAERERSDWFIEPLLTLRQVSELLNVSSRRVRTLGLKAIDLDGQIRYHPAEVRRYITARQLPDERGRGRRGF